MQFLLPAVDTDFMQRSLTVIFFPPCLLSDGGGVRAEGKCFRRGAESASPQYGRQPERPLSAALLHYTEGSGF